MTSNTSLKVKVNVRNPVLQQFEIKLCVLSSLCELIVLAINPLRRLDYFKVRSRRFNNSALCEIDILSICKKGYNVYADYL